MTYSLTTTGRQIIDETIKQIRENGYESISLRQLASNVGLTTGAFYKHFSGKDALFKEVATTLSSRLSTDIMEHLDLTSSPQSQLLNMANQLIQKFQSEPKTMVFLFFNPITAGLLNDSKMAENFDFYRLVTTIITQLQSNYPRINSRTLFIQIWSFIQGYGLLIINSVTSYDADLVASTLAEFLKA